MARLLAVSGDPELATRMLRMYIQVVSKAREAGESASNPNVQVESGIEMETDRQWVQTLVRGSRMLCRCALQEGEYGKAVELAKEAGRVLQKAKEKADEEDKELIGSIQLAEGIWHSVMAYTGALHVLPTSHHFLTSRLPSEQTPRTRTTHLTESLQLFHTALETYPTASVHHHLALALARPGPSKDIQAAIEQARAAVEADSNEPRHWHLLGLLLAATGDWRAANGVLELGIDTAEADLNEDGDAAQEANGSAGNISVRDFGHPLPNGNGIHPPEDGVSNHVAEQDTPDEASSQEPQQPMTVVVPDATTIPPSSRLLQPITDRPTPNQQECFEYALQMRMTSTLR